MKIRRWAFAVWFFAIGTALFRINPLLFSPERFAPAPRAVKAPVYLRDEAKSDSTAVFSRPMSGPGSPEVLVTENATYSDLGDGRFVAASRDGRILWDLRLAGLGAHRVRAKLSGDSLFLIDEGRAVVAVHAMTGEIAWVRPVTSAEELQTLNWTNGRTQ